MTEYRTTEQYSSVHVPLLLKLVIKHQIFCAAFIPSLPRDDEFLAAEIFKGLNELNLSSRLTGDRVVTSLLQLEHKKQKFRTLFNCLSCSGHKHAVG